MDSPPVSRFSATPTYLRVAILFPWKSGKDLFSIFPIEFRVELLVAIFSFVESPLVIVILRLVRFGWTFDLSEPGNFAIYTSTDFSFIAWHKIPRGRLFLIAVLYGHPYG